MKKKKLKAKVAILEKELAHRQQMVTECLGVLEWRTGERDKLRAELEALQVATEAEVKRKDARIEFLGETNDKQFSALQVARAEHECVVDELKAQLEQAQSSAHRYYKLYIALQSDVDKRRRQEEEQAAWLEQEMARLKDEGF